MVPDTQQSTRYSMETDSVLEPLSYQLCISSIYTMKNTVCLHTKSSTLLCVIVMHQLFEKY